MAAEFIRRALTTVALCWRIERRDGIALGFTSHDRDMTIDGLRYSAAPGMLPSAVALSDGFDGEALEVGGAISSAAIDAEDLAAGRWDGARVRIFMVDWQEATGDRLLVARGELGDVNMRGSAFEAELRGAAAMLERPVVEQTTPECRAMLGDGRCRVDMAGRLQVTRIAAVEDESALIVEEAAAGNAYAFGRIRWLGGANCGLAFAILSSDGPRLVLRDPPHHPAATGDLVEISEGCDKRLETCSGRFANALNFRGEPHLPGFDLLTRYPGA
jgi:uncharacterized phage protein (TIGR02218 family)